MPWLSSPTENCVDVAAEGLRQRVAGEPAGQAERGRAGPARRRSPAAPGGAAGRPRRRPRGRRRPAWPRWRTRPTRSAACRPTVRAEPATSAAASSTAGSTGQPVPSPSATQVGQRLEARLLGHEARASAGRRPSRPPATAAAAGHDGHRAGRRPASLRRSRVPALWSTMPTTRNSVALNSAWRDQQGEPAERGRPGADAHQHDEEAQLADGAVGQQHLDVVLPQRPPAAEQHRGRAEASAAPGRQAGVPANTGASTATR